MGESSDDQERGGNEGPARGRLRTFYAGLAAFVVIGLTAALVIGSGREAEPSFSGLYEIRPPDGCLGRTFDLTQSGQFASLSTPDGGAGGPVRVDEGEITGKVECLDSSAASLDLTAADGSIVGKRGKQPISAKLTAGESGAAAQVAVRPLAVAGIYVLAPTSSCLGTTIELAGSDDAIDLRGAGEIAGRASYGEGRLRGSARCAGGARVDIRGEAVDRQIQIELVPAKPANGAQPERLEATKEREFSSTLALFFAALVVVMGAARLFGQLAVWARQPRVMGEVIAGIALGPTVFGALAPEAHAVILPTDLIPVLGIVANLGLVFYVFMIGVEVDPTQIRSRIGQAVAISNASAAIPMVLGVAVAIPTYELVGPDVGFTEFALFMGIAMSITAFPVLARILAERGMLNRPIGAVAMAAAAIDDVTAWFLIGLASAVAAAGSGGDVAISVGLAIAFCLVMFFAVRPLLARAFAGAEGKGRVPTGLLAAVFAAVLLTAATTEVIGIALIFGAFVMGLIMPRGTDLTGDVITRMEDFVMLVLLPVFFVYTGLRTDIGLLDRPELWLLTVGLLLVAILGKFGGAMLGARVSGYDWRSSAVLGTLMNTRGLTELIVLNLALEIGVISEVLFAALVLMALITTFMAGPLLNLLDSRNTLGAPVEPPSRASA